MVRFFIGLCVLVYTMTAFGGGQVRLLSSPLPSQSLRWGALDPLLVWQEPWRLVSAVYVHLGLLHLFMNMSALVSLGAGLERAFGSTRFVITFVGTAIFGFVVSTGWELWGLGPLARTAGASGGLFGLVGFEVGYLYRARDPRWKQALGRAVIGAVLIALLMPANNAAHVGGAVGGLVMGYASFREALWRRFSQAWRLLAVLLTLGSLSSLVLANMSLVWKVQRAVEIHNGTYGGQAD